MSTKAALDRAYVLSRADDFLDGRGLPGHVAGGGRNSERPGNGNDDAKRDVCRKRIATAEVAVAGASAVGMHEGDVASDNDVRSAFEKRKHGEAGNGPDGTFPRLPVLASPNPTQSQRQERRPPAMSTKTPAGRDENRSSAAPAAVLVPNGFDVLAARVDAALQEWNPDAVPADLPKPERKKELERAVHAKKTKLNRLIRSGFRAQLGRVRVEPTKRPAADPSPMRQSKRLRASRSSAASSSKSPPSSSAGADVAFRDDSIAPPHPPIPHSVRSAPYRRMKSKRMVRLGVGDEIILVVPEVDGDTPEACRSALEDVHGRVDAVLLKSCTGATASERADGLARLKRNHAILRGGKTVYEFPARVKRYDGRFGVENDGLRESDLDRLWEGGDFGIRIELCGYAKSLLALIRMKYFAYVEIFQRTDAFAGDDVEFDRAGDIDGPLLEQLWAAHGCASTTAEVMMKYYQKVAARKQHRIGCLQDTIQRLKAKNKALEDKSQKEKVGVDGSEWL